MRNIPSEEQINALFGRSKESDPAETGAFIKANHGTLFINRVEQLSEVAQNLVLRTLLPWEVLHTDSLAIDSLDVRLIVGTDHGLEDLYNNKNYSEELYFILNSMTLTIPPLKDRMEDLMNYFDKSIEKYNEEYNRFLTVTPEGRELDISPIRISKHLPSSVI